MVTFSLLNAIDPTTIIFIVLLALLIVALLIVPMFTNKKRAKQTDELHRSLRPGDMIKTIGGIVGTIKEIRQISPVDKEMVIETGEEGSKTTMVLDIQALYMVISRSSTIVPAAEEKPVEELEPQNDVTENLAPAEPAPEVSESPVEQPIEEATQTTVNPAEQSVMETPVKKPQQKSGAKKSGGSKKTNK